MSEPFRGVVNFDIRDSVEDWTPFVQPKAPDDAPIATGKHLFVAEFVKTGDDPDTASALGTLTLYIDTQPVGKAEIMTQPGNFALTGDGLGVGRDSSSPVSPNYAAPFDFTAGTIDRVVVDVSGDHSVDHEKEAHAWLWRD